MDTILKEIRLKNWKSFQDATLYIDPFTVLIGTNASGKSNILDALVFLQRIADGLDVQTALGGNESLPALRGGVSGAVYKSGESFKISIVESFGNCMKLPQTSELENVHDFKVSVNHLKIDREWHSNYKVIDKSLKECLKNDLEIDDSIFEINLSNIIKIKQKISYKFHEYYYARKSGAVIEFKEISSDFESDIVFLCKVSKEVPNKNFLILDTSPNKIRNYSRYSQNLLPDASNLAGFLIALPKATQQDIEQTLTEYLSQLPEKDIKRVWAEPVGRLGSDAMLYCEEEWIDGQTQIIDAHSMSDGTLRFLAILTALLTRPEGSLLAIEEVDNGLHPSRMHLLLTAIREIGARRNLDILVTTHNPALLDNLPPEMMPFVQVVHRDMHTGASKITPLDDIEQLPKLLASGSLGKITTRGELEQSLQAQDAKHD